MGAVGVRELNERTSEVVRRVREGGETIDVTYRGRVVARLIPASGAYRDGETGEAMPTGKDQPATGIGSARRARFVTVDELLEEQRNGIAARPVDPEELAAWWAEHDRLVEEIGAHWPEGVSAVDAIREQRREL